MEKILITIVLTCMLFAGSCQGNIGEEISEEYRSLLEGVFNRAGDHAENLKGLLRGVPEEWKPGLVFLISYMPDADLKTIDPEILRENLEYAFKARKEFPWASSIPESVFNNDVLPYAVIDETREPWRKKFYEIFSQKVRGFQDMRSAIEAVNGAINEDVGVEYNTRRQKTNQSPSESMRQKMASCTGLAILLVDAFRSVGIPARFAGTASWHDDRGNHSWVEVWMDGDWHVTEYYMPRKLGYPWFLANSAKAREHERKYAVYASSYKSTGDYFPMVWNPDSKQVNGVNVTGRYIDIYSKMMSQAKLRGSHVPVMFRMFKTKGETMHSEDRIAVNVDVFDGDLQVDGGRTSGPVQDMNDVLTFLLEKGKTYTFRYQDANGKTVNLNAGLKEVSITVDGYME